MATANRGTGNQRQVHERDFSQQATYFLQSFIVESFERESVVNAPTLTEIRADEEVEETAVVQFHESWSEIGLTFRRIADSIDQGEDFQRVVSDIPKDPSIDEIMCYVRDVFSDGEINWGRIVALFYFAYKVCVKKFESYMERTFPAWVNKLVYALVKFLVLKFADWIVNRGGWKSIQEYFGTSDIIWKGLVVLSLLTLSLGIYKLKT